MVRFDGQLASDVIVRYFFFQAEDGIRDVAVTGVQTCALPISSRRRHTRCSRDWSSDVCSSDLGAVARLSALIAPPYDVISQAERARLAALDAHNIVHVMLPEKIGRASCRERV